MSIDYGMGLTNIDKTNGIRYGVIHQNEVLQAWCDSAEPNYGKPSCPSCGDDSAELAHTDHDEHEYFCDACELGFDSEDAYPDEAYSYYLDDGEYLCEAGEDGDIFVMKSPFYTRAEFCSPCAPGACYLINSTTNGEKAYCLGHDWFDSGKAPYPVYRVSDDSAVV
jgi:hypothetical protein